MKTFILGIVLLSTCYISQAFSEGRIDRAVMLNEAIYQVQTDWAIANYQLTGKQQKESFLKLVESTDNLTANYPEAAEAWIWSGIVKSSYAGVKGGLGALPLAKQSKKELEKALQLNDQALSGSAYTSLATLYAQVPGWPVGFGSDKKAQALFEKALTINPQGIDSNYFYAEFMLDKGQLDEAEKYYLIAKGAAPRPSRPLADSGRQQEISSGLEKVQSKLKR